MTTQELRTSNVLFACVGDEETESILRGISLQSYELKYEGIVGGVKEALKYLKQNRSPKVFIIDLSNSELPINDMAQLSEVCEPGVEVIAIGVRNDVGVFRELVKLGIRDYLVKPLMEAHVIRSLENILSHNKGAGTVSTFSKFGKIVSFIGSRGGVGVTTLATNCAWLLSEKQSRRISLIDPDLQLGTIAQFLDLELTSRPQDILEAPERIDSALIERFMIKYSTHLMVLCGQSSLEDMQAIDPQAFEAIIRTLVSNFHYTIFDLPRCFSNGVNVSILDNTNIIVLVTDLSITGLKDTHRYLNLFKNHRTTDQQVILVVNKHGEYGGGEIEIEDFEKALNHKINLFLPFDGRHPLKALTKGVPLVSEFPKSSLTNSLEELTEMIIGRRAGGKKSPFQSLKRFLPFRK